MTRTVAEAFQLVLEHAGRQPAVQVPLFRANGLVLAEPVVADLDSPPFTKALMDGFAVKNADLTAGGGGAGNSRRTGRRAQPGSSRSLPVARSKS